jgi:hypothetical protein
LPFQSLPYILAAQSKPMKRRNRKRYMLNLLSIALLAIALYLNFIKKDTGDASTQFGVKAAGSTQSKTDSRSSLVDHTAETFVVK